MTMKVTPNQLTVFRIFLAVIVLLLVLVGRAPLYYFIAMLAFTAAIITDWYDGKIARENDMISTFGKIADPIADKILMLGIFAVFSYLGLYSFWWISIIFLREIIVTIVRLVLLRQGKVIPAEQAGKLKVGFQIGSIYASFLFLMSRGTGFFFEPIFQILNMTGILLANALTIYSGLTFFFNLFDVHRNRPAYFFATSGFVGKIPFAPGTWGSLLGIPIVLLLNEHMHLLFFVLVVLTAVGIWSGEQVARMQGHPDPGCVVLDETCGMLTSFLFVPISPVVLLIGFAGFRFFDIAKPFGIRLVERKFPGGLGIMLDDLVAGVLTNLSLHLILFLWAQIS